MQSEILNRKFSEKEVKDSYLKVAWFYDFWSLLTEKKAAKIAIEFAEIKNGESVLEVAVGTGLLFKQVLKQNPSGINRGIEMSPSMLLRAKKRAHKLKRSHYTLEIVDAYHLSFEENAFDVLINNFMLDLLPEKDFEKIASEFYRVLKPKGRAVISTMAFPQKWYNKYWLWVARKFPDLLTGCRPVSIAQSLREVGFIVEKTVQISQNTFPAEIIKVVKKE